MHVYALLVLLTYVSLHGAIYFVNVDRYLRLDVAWVICLVRFHIPDALHVLDIWSTPAPRVCRGWFALTSTCALSHLSILKDLTLEMCVPSLRCRAAHRMQRKMPSYSSCQNLFRISRGLEGAM